MADDRFIWIDVEGEEKILMAMRTYEERSGRHIREFVNDLSEFAARILVTTVPVGKSEYLMRHVDRTAAQWRPGGAGGGGEWQGIAGIKAGSSMHPLYVDQGTGIYAGKGRIYPRQARVLRFEKPMPEVEYDRHGNVRGVTTVRYRRWVRGQPGQRFLYHTWVDVVMYAEHEIIRRNLL